MVYCQEDAAVAPAHALSPARCDETLSQFAFVHMEGSATVATCARDDLLEKRRPIMQRCYCQREIQPGSRVTRIGESLLESVSY